MTEVTLTVFNSRHVKVQAVHLTFPWSDEGQRAYCSARLTDVKSLLNSSKRTEPTDRVLGAYTPDFDISNDATNDFFSIDNNMIILMIIMTISIDNNMIILMIIMTSSIDNNMIILMIIMTISIDNNMIIMMIVMTISIALFRVPPDRLVGRVVTAPVSRAEDCGLIPTFAARTFFRVVIPVT